VRIPGFTGTASLGATSQPYRRFAAGARTAGTVNAQLKGGGFRPRLGGTFGTLEDYWACKSRCDTARSACLATCEGTWESPKASRNCILCDDDYRACIAGCSSDIA
jgi:hypothetical protein